MLTHRGALSFRTKAGKYPGCRAFGAASLTNGLGCSPLDPRDWTRESSAIGASLKGFGRSPIPASRFVTQRCGCFYKHRGSP